jgi:hypothetical protein
MSDPPLCSKTLRECERRARRSGYGDLGDEFKILAEQIEGMIADELRKVYFFGCWNDDTGHYLHEPTGRSVHRGTDATPWGMSIDGVLPPAGPDVQGRCLLHHKDGWTALAFWDRSVDTRPGSNAALLVEGEFSFEDMVDLFVRHFPGVLKRFSFNLTQVHGESAGARKARERGR